MRREQPSKRRGFRCLLTGVFFLLAGSLAIWTAYAASPAFALRRIELVFQNGRTDIVVPRRFPNLRVYATLNFSGTGILRATWKVDGRPIGLIAEPVVFGERLVFASGPTVILPTTDPGQHTVTLEIDHPKPALRLRRITYFVTAEEYEDFQRRKLPK